MASGIKREPFTVVVPTMWKYPPFLDFIQDLVDFELVGEVIIHNNNVAETPNHPVLNHSKVRHYAHPQNIFVNPVFNHGVRTAQHSRICLMNDDVIFDLRIFYRVHDILTENTGIVGICPGLSEFKQIPFECGATKIVPWTGQHTFGFGCLMFVHREAYIPIPDTFHLYYGDNWIFDTALRSGRTNYLITDAFYYTPYATTCRNLPNIDQNLAAERAAFDHAMAEFMNSLKKTNQ
jgi:hypothetical protein